MKRSGAVTVIIGNGVAGNSAASAIRQVSKDIPITMISQEPFPEYSPCLLSKKFISGEMKKEEVFLKNFEDYSKDGIRVVFGHKVTKLDAKQKRLVLGTSSLSYEKLIIATGGKPVVPRISGVEQKGVFTLKSLDDAEKILNYSGEKAVVIGAGAIGVEASISLRKRGWQIILLELMGHILPAMFDREASLIMKKQIEDYGIVVLTEERVVRLDRKSCVYSVITDKREIKCDMVILTLGIRPNVELAQEAGVKIGSFGGIKVDRHMMTNVKNIYACGDCVETKDIITGEDGLCLLWYNAKQQGEIAGYNAAGIEKNHYGNMNIGSIEIPGTFGVSIGHTESSLRDTKLSTIEGRRKWYHKLLLSKAVLVGAQLVGKSEDIGPLVSAIRRGDTVERLNKVICDGNLLSKNPMCFRLSPYIKEGFCIGIASDI